MVDFFSSPVDDLTFLTGTEMTKLKKKKQPLKPQPVTGTVLGTYGDTEGKASTCYIQQILYYVYWYSTFFCIQTQKRSPHAPKGKPNGKKKLVSCEVANHSIYNYTSL